MNEAKPFASLSPSLLARKGSARPAMRPQIQPLQQFHEATARQLEEDLGWNDMGHDLADHGEHASAAAEQIAPVAEPVATAAVVSLVPVAPMPEPHVPEVLRQQAEVAQRVGAEVEKPAPVRRSALKQGRRAAFTLRLDAERHLKLRLACTVAGRSAQQLVTDALDKLIGGLPEVESLAAQVRRSK